MRQMGLTEYCQDIHQIDSARLIEQFQNLERERNAIRATIAEDVERSQALLEEQYDRLFGVGQGQ